jgi:hypothetical protein
VFVEQHLSDVALQVAHAALDGLAAQELAQQRRVEVVGVSDVEREVVRRLGALVGAGQLRGDEMAVGMGVHVGIGQPRVDVVDELAPASTRTDGSSSRSPAWWTSP